SHSTETSNSDAGPLRRCRSQSRRSSSLMINDGRLRNDLVAPPMHRVQSPPELLGDIPRVDAVPDQLRLDEDDDLLPLLALRRIAEQVAQKLDLVNPGNAGFCVAVAVGDQPAKHNRLAARHG